MTISDEAFKAVDIAVMRAMHAHGSDGRLDGHKEIARAALEAAAPHILLESFRSEPWFENLVMAEARSYHSGGNCKLCKPSMAEAWDEGEAFGEDRGTHEPIVNPYRKDVTE